MKLILRHLALVLALLTFFFLMPSLAHAGWYKPNWGYRKPITIANNTGGELTNYQVKIEVAYDSDMQPDFDDIRFTQSDGTTEIPYWLESKTDSSLASFWVKVPSIPAGESTIYMYYGNPTASSESSKENTMGFVDVPVGADADDGEEDGRVHVVSAHAWKTGGYYGDGADFLGYHPSFDSPFEPAWRFDNITASGIALDGCKIILYHNDGHTESGTSELAYLYGIDEADPAPFSDSSGNRPSDRPKTTASVSWNPAAETANGTHEQAESPEIKTIIQELLDSYTYTGTQAMAFYWRVESTSTWWRNYDDYSSSGGIPATLHIEYRKHALPEPTASVGSEEGDTVTIPSSTGKGDVTFAADKGCFTSYLAVSEAILPEEGKPNLTFTYGFFSFTIKCLTPGETVTLNVILPSDAPIGTQYWKYNSNTDQWYQIGVGSDDGDNIITIQLTDAGTGDHDGTSNGIIVDPGGPGIRTAPVPTMTEWGMIIFSLLLAGTAIFVLRRRLHAG